VHADRAARSTQFLQQMPAHVPFDFIDWVREGLIAAFGPNREIREFERRYLFPGSLAQLMQIVSGSALRRSRDRKVSYAQNSFQALDYGFQGRIPIEL
jgi:hypothetical protein